MSIVIVGPSGHVSSVIANHLLDAGADVVLLARSPEKVKDLVARGAEVLQGSMDDEQYVINATEGADALFWFTPPKLDSDDYREFQRRLARNAANAIAANEIPYVVNLSSLGAHLSEGLGPVSGLHEVEKELEKTATNIVHLRAASFYENHLMDLETAKNTGKIFAPVDGAKAHPHVASRDIGDVAAELLLNLNWEGRSVRGVFGPADLSYEDVAQVFSDVLGKRIEFVRVTPEATIESMMAFGISRNVATSFVEMFTSHDAGRFVPAETRSVSNTTSTTFAEFIRGVTQRAGRATPPTATAAPAKRARPKRGAA